jgi:hypothetical protein
MFATLSPQHLILAIFATLLTVSHAAPTERGSEALQVLNLVDSKYGQGQWWLTASNECSQNCKTDGGSIAKCEVREKQAFSVFASLGKAGDLLKDGIQICVRTASVETAE